MTQLRTCTPSKIRPDPNWNIFHFRKLRDEIDYIVWLQTAWFEMAVWHKLGSSAAVQTTKVRYTASNEYNLHELPAPTNFRGQATSIVFRSSIVNQLNGDIDSWAHISISQWIDEMIIVNSMSLWDVEGKTHSYHLHYYYKNNFYELNLSKLMSNIEHVWRVPAYFAYYFRAKNTI